jgi:RNA polymerase sigma-70 factor (ECF subfamily)
MKATGAAKQAGMKQEEFEKLFSEHHRMVYRAAYSVTGNEDDAQDVLQTLFLRLIDKGLTLESVSNVAGYLYRAAINEARQKYRTRIRQKLTDDDVEDFLDPAEDRHRGETDMRERLLEAMARLEPKDAEMLVLWADHGYTDAQIAEMLGKTRDAVAVALHRAKARLKELMCGELKKEESNET